MCEFSSIVKFGSHSGVSLLMTPNFLLARRNAAERASILPRDRHPDDPSSGMFKYMLPDSSGASRALGKELRRLEKDQFNRALGKRPIKSLKKLTLDTPPSPFTRIPMVHLDPSVALVRYKDVAGPIHRHPGGVSQLTRPLALTAQPQHHRAARVENLAG